MLELLTFLLMGSIFGVATAITTSIFDFAMDFGHLLGQIRYRKAKKICNQLNLSLLFEKFEETLTKMTDFTERLEYADSFYWKLAAIKNSFTVWICVICLGFRINFVLSFLLAFSGILFGEGIIEMFNFFAASVLVNFFFLKKVI